MSAAVRIRLMLLVRRNPLGEASVVEGSTDSHGQGQVGAVHCLPDIDLQKAVASNFDQPTVTTFSPAPSSRHL